MKKILLLILSSTIFTTQTVKRPWEWRKPNSRSIKIQLKQQPTFKQAAIKSIMVINKANHVLKEKLPTKATSSYIVKSKMLTCLNCKKKFEKRSICSHVGRCCQELRKEIPSKVNRRKFKYDCPNQKCDFTGGLISWGMHKCNLTHDSSKRTTASTSKPSSKKKPSQMLSLQFLLDQNRAQHRSV